MTGRYIRQLPVLRNAMLLVAKITGTLQPNAGADAREGDDRGSPALCAVHRGILSLDRPNTHL
ncbi:MAG: hypothetical protein IIA63_03555 [Nitrospinae bacterium]|nr:hypothetical protein [Nitrospinota bacterium]